MQQFVVSPKGLIPGAATGEAGFALFARAELRGRAGSTKLESSMKRWDF
jgi:hypothetical protein